MRAIFGVLSLVIVLAVVGVLAKKQLSSLSVAPVAASPTAKGQAAAPVATPQAQSLQIQQQIKQTVERSLQQAHSASDDQ